MSEMGPDPDSLAALPHLGYSAHSGSPGALSPCPRSAKSCREQVQQKSAIECAAWTARGADLIIPCWD
jgi:hypothetical protein